MFKRAVVLAGGKGTRLRPYTVAIPKPLVPVGDYPISEIIIKQLIVYGFDHITVAVGHQSDIIRSYLGNGSKWGVKIDYSMESEPLGTIGPLKLIPDLPENFLVMNGDILTDLDFGALFNHHASSRNILTLASHLREEVNPYGVLSVDGGGYLRDFKEKPSLSLEISMGVHIANKKILSYIPEERPYGLNDLTKDLIAANLPVKVQRHTGYWLDIGIPKDYQQAADDFDKMKDGLLTPKVRSNR